MPRARKITINSTARPHPWATLFLYRIEQTLRGNADLDFLKSAFHKLMLNFTWWVNRKDRFGKNVFEGGFLGLDNIGIFDRSAPLPTGGGVLPGPPDASAIAILTIFFILINHVVNYHNCLDT
jgi:hypothetical protein